ncbi:TetR/AcrR family transcriptional regulator [Spirosoma sp.]|uniref:TetR/AcrR family transcriptional regulator n=1 Tax=Spirosoma sp. TaxID=1899569 RepID=UPI003B3AFFFA
MILKKVVKRRNKEKTIVKILQAAGDAIARGGVSKAGVNAIAKQAGINKVLLYRYFNGWNGLIEALYQHSLEDIHAQVTAVSSSPVVIETYAVQYYQTLHTNPALPVLIRWQMDNKLTELGRNMAAHQDEFLKQVESASGVEIGLIRLLMAGITHSVLTEDKQEDGAAVLTEPIIRRFSARLAPVESTEVQ